ncbi:MAG: phosphoribosylamine--glycine ligase, partial [Candidatus Heimdallarchaeota archaeon]|nr:phosphoribosylamine--glycine ligase [Candidatus Heimdallarchaeota archaeon]
MLLIGNGARENALAEALVRGGAELYAYMAKRNPGIAKLCKGRVKVGNLKEFAVIGAYGQENHIDFAVVGPEAPLAMG